MAERAEGHLRGQAALAVVGVMHGGGLLERVSLGRAVGRRDASMRFGEPVVPPVPVARRPWIVSMSVRAKGRLSEQAAMTVVGMVYEDGLHKRVDLGRAVEWPEASEAVSAMRQWGAAHSTDLAPTLIEASRPPTAFPRDTRLRSPPPCITPTTANAACPRRRPSARSAINTPQRVEQQWPSGSRVDGNDGSI